MFKLNVRLVSLLSLALISVGCGSSAPFEYIPVSGQLTYEDGSTIPASGMKLQFHAEGKFSEATSYKFGDGLIPGKHKVAIGYATDKAGKLLVPKTATGLGTTEIIVDTAQLPLAIKVPKP